ncbi:hypothetical protein BN946_scf185007.g34 [Trametes cinnabarina]|uniref:Chromo domain-containing protein n=1 Tax=Pycnoporus cinnabarinus TaxID=5643 RepID=A0A060SF22_PYCCI|nr:hypothetical protein BN946_scf185007.g34 [Trametes cinnabarina]
MAKDETDSAPSETELSEYQTQFVPQENDEEDLWDVLEILEERGRKYKVRWAGIDPSTKKPWAPSWVPKHDCTDDLIHEWKKKKAAKKEEAEKRRKSKARSSIASSSKNKRSASTSTAATTRQTRRLTKQTAPSTSTRPTSRADSPPQPSSSRVTLQDSKPHKRSRIAHDSPTEDAAEDLPGLSRPRKKRKVEVEVVAGSSSSETEDEELLNPQPLKQLKATQSCFSPVQLPPTVRRLLAQEEEESTQEAEGIIPSSPPRTALLPKSLKTKGLQAKGSILFGIHRASPSDEKLALKGRPSANDTFSREGIVPETQASAPSGSQEPPAPNPSQISAPLLAPAAPSTPPRAQSNRQLSHSGRGSSIKTKMKPKRSKELRPIPVVTPSVFRPHLPSADVEEIEEWSSPERDKQVAARLDILTQESIELAQFTQDQVESFVDWDGGMPPEVDPFVTDEDEPALSLGPQLASPHADRRQAMQSVLDKRPSSAQRRLSEADISPEIPLMEELPPTSTTARAEVDSQSQQVVPDSQTQGLSAMLEEKEQQLNQLELQIEDLQVQLKAAKTETSEKAARFEAQLKSLQDGSDEKSEQISQLESQLVELQLQVTQVTSEQEQQRELHEAEVHELREALEERTEQISQLESALVELHTEISALAEENEKLTQAQQQSADKHTEKLAAAEQCAASGPPERILYVCQHVHGTEMCNSTFASPQSLIDHAWKTHYPGLEAYAE